MKFSETSDYGSVLNRLKIEFEKKWKENAPASIRTASDFEEISVLGSGAFGIVVSRKISLLCISVVVLRILLSATIKFAHISVIFIALKPFRNL